MTVRGFTLQTQRLTLREMTASDADAMYDIDRSPQHHRYDADPPRTPEEYQDITQWLEITPDEVPRKFYYMAVMLKEAPLRMIGGVHITIHAHEHQQAEIGYSLHSALWGQGYATEAAFAMRDFAFATLHMHRLFANEIILENIASRQIALKLGMRLEATLRDTHYFQDRWWTSCIYAMTRDEWQALPPDS